MRTQKVYSELKEKIRMYRNYAWEIKKKILKTQSEAKRTELFIHLLDIFERLERLRWEEKRKLRRN